MSSAENSFEAPPLKIETHGTLELLGEKFFARSQIFKIHQGSHSYLNIDASDERRRVIVYADVTRKGFAQKYIAKVLRENQQWADGHWNATRVAAYITLHQLHESIA